MFWGVAWSWRHDSGLEYDHKKHTGSLGGLAPSYWAGAIMFGRARTVCEMATVIVLSYLVPLK